MKKLLLFISLFIFFIVPVKADTTYNINVPVIDKNLSFCGNGGCDLSLDTAYNQLISIYNSSYSSDYDSYFITYENFNGQYILLNLNLFNSSQLTFSFSSSSIDILADYNGTRKFIAYNDSTNSFEEYNGTGYNSTMISSGGYNYFDSNFDILIQNYNYTFTGVFSLSDVGSFPISSILPKLKDLYNYNSWSGYNNGDTYTTINLDDYEYVLLSLKNYNQSQPFQTNLQVKGQIGITPIYNYGQTSKDSITGSQVQDRCNISYENYTSYPFYILQTDLQNNVIYAVKECESGSSFKFDNTIFDVTYVTQENSSNPTITIGGHTYDVIPYEDLPSTATKNEADNYIPGQSGSAVDSGGIDSAIKGVQQGLSTLWNTFTYFTDLVGLIFSSLPIELRTILLSAFVVAITIGLIKLFTN